MANNRRYWDVLSRVMSTLWGEDGRSPGEEVTKTVVIRVIESCIVADDPWEGELETSVGGQSHNVFRSLSEAGWFSVRRRGLVDMVTVKPRIGMLFTMLSEFARQEPEYIGGQVRSILLNLRSVTEDSADPNACSAYQIAAKQARQCMAHIVNTGCRVQDLMDSLVELDSARDFVHGFFTDFVERVYIADYSELRTRNHPLQYRGQIIEKTYALMDEEPSRERLVVWYTEHIGRGDREKGEAAYRRDTNQLLRLNNIEDHLARLDEEINIANQRALALIEYKLRAPKHLDKLIKRACAALSVLDEDHPALPGDAGGVHWSALALAKPRKPPRDQVATAVETIELSDEELAMEWLRRRMVENRKVTAVQLANYVARMLDGRNRVDSDMLEVGSINDLCCYQRLLLIASRDDAPLQLRRHDPVVQMLRGIRIRFEEERMTNNDYMIHRRFVVEREEA
ncbi:Wadjet anti-phage system protein JetA family protein [Rhodanobacter sp. C05]|uniref:Wadjet anti-phage system protein JetA family protein n=1 Tax=Rhodanobacter sp. C05 TaxID=1945855 RepID=UPI00157C95A5|nr:Wadjet anti-phage system protein JetA family protein [Rhodanobacter sp. C05]